MTKAQANYTEITKCCKYCKHLRKNLNNMPYCSLFENPDVFVKLEAFCDSFKNVW